MLKILLLHVQATKNTFAMGSYMQRAFAACCSQSPIWAVLAMATPQSKVSYMCMPKHTGHLLQDGFQDFVNRCEAAEFEDSVLAQQGKMSLRDLQKMRQSAGNQYATKPASELAMDNREAWEVCIIPPATAFHCLAIALPICFQHKGKQDQHKGKQVQ